MTTTPAADRHDDPKPAKTRAHLSSASDNWPTPQNFFDALHVEFGFVLDVCASSSNHKAAHYYALDHADPDRRDGLAGDWAADAAELGGAVWMNSPYGRPIAAWMAKAHAAARAGAVVVTLVPVRADTAWWHTHVLATGAEVRYVRGRLTFGDAVNTAAFASAVVIYRPTDIPGAPGPVGTMPAHPEPRAVSGDAASRDAGTVNQSLDCTTSRAHTASTNIEHLFDGRTGGRAAAPVAEPELLARTRPAGRAMSPTETPTVPVNSLATRLDRLLVLAVAALAERTNQTGAGLRAAASSECLEVAREVVDRHGGLGSGYRHTAAVQHLYSVLWTYLRTFAPAEGWQLLSTDPDAGQVAWGHVAAAGRRMLDCVTTLGDLSSPDLPAGAAGQLVRLVDLTDPTRSFLRLPHADVPLTWTTSRTGSSARRATGRAAGRRSAAPAAARTTSALTERVSA